MHRVEPSGLHFGTSLTSTCLRSRHLHVVKGIPVQWFSDLLFPLHILAIYIVVLIDVIDLSHQIIEFGEDGYCKMLIWNLKNWAVRDLFLPSPSQRTPFPEAEHCSE
jgi:hypothetical protein